MFHSRLNCYECPGLVESKSFKYYLQKNITTMMSVMDIMNCCEIREIPRKNGTVWVYER